MLKFLRNNIGTPAENGFIPKGLPSFNDSVFGYNYNPDLARELINDVKISVGSELGVIRLSTTSSYLDICEYIQNELLALGLNVVIDVNPPSINRQMMATSKLSFFRAGWIADYPDAENYLSLFYGKNFSPSGPNYTHFKNDEFDKLYQLALSENNDYLRYNYYNKMDKIIIDNAVIVPLYYDKVLRFSHKNIFGLTNNPINMLNLKTVNKVLVNP
jgi:peptide/nickel transport system substrate-binding protein